MAGFWLFYIFLKFLSILKFISFSFFGGCVVFDGLCVFLAGRFVGFFRLGYNFYTKQKQVGLLSGAKFVRLAGCLDCCFLLSKL